jgi:hypothetical protein
MRIPVRVVAEGSRRVRSGKENSRCKYRARALP